MLVRSSRVVQKTREEVGLTILATPKTSSPSLTSGPSEVACFRGRSAFLEAVSAPLRNGMGRTLVAGLAVVLGAIVCW